MAFFSEESTSSILLSLDAINLLDRDAELDASMKTPFMINLTVEIPNHDDLLFVEAKSADLASAVSEASSISIDDESSTLEESSFWSSSFWLPEKYTWADVPVAYSRMDIVCPLLLSFFILAFRMCFERVAGIVLDHVMNSVIVPKPSTTTIQDLTNDVSDRKGIRTRFHACFVTCLIGFAANASSTPLNRKKVLETVYRVFAYTILFAYGLAVLYDKEWMYDFRLCWANYPVHKVDSSLWWYYMIETAFYCSLLWSCAFDHRRSDFVTTVIHHFVTIGLLYFSYSTNFVRVGTVFILLHDVSDVVLEYTKLLRYSKAKELYLNIGFVIFLISWFITRLYYFPSILYSAIFDAPQLIDARYTFFSAPLNTLIVPRMLVALLSVLFTLHLFWTYLIAKIVKQTLTDGKPTDVRSDDEEEEKVDDHRSFVEPASTINQSCVIEDRVEKDELNARRMEMIFVNCSSIDNAMIDDITHITKVDTVIPCVEWSRSRRQNEDVDYFEKSSQLYRRRLLKSRRIRDELRRG